MVIEDNVGGLTLLVMEEEKVAYVHSGYEHTPGELTRDIKDIRYPVPEKNIKEAVRYNVYQKCCVLKFLSYLSGSKKKEE